jgi:hypothetical protein
VLANRRWPQREGLIPVKDLSLQNVIKVKLAANGSQSIAQERNALFAEMEAAEHGAITPSAAAGSLMPAWVTMPLRAHGQQDL